MTCSPSSKQLTQATDCPFEQFITPECLVALTSSIVKKLKKIKQNHLLIQIGFVNYAYTCAAEKKKIKSSVQGKAFINTDTNIIKQESEK